MDEGTFSTYRRHAKLLAGDYGAGYLRGLNRHFHGELYGTAKDHAIWMRLGLKGDDSRAERGRGYRDGFAGKPPEPLRGRPPGEPDHVKSVTLHVRVTQEQAEKFARLGASDWMRRTIDEAPEPRR